MRTDGVISVTRNKAASDDTLIKYQHLNPATYFEEVAHSARCVVLAGGTMSPACIHLSFWIWCCYWDNEDPRHDTAIISEHPLRASLRIILWARYSSIEPSVCCAQKRSSRQRSWVQVQESGWPIARMLRSPFSRVSVWPCSCFHKTRLRS